MAERYTRRHRNYPWEKWLNDGRDTIVFERGKQFVSQAHLFRSTAYSWCRAHGYAISTAVREDRVVLTVLSRPAASAAGREDDAAGDETKAGTEVALW